MNLSQNSPCERAQFKHVHCPELCGQHSLIAHSTGLVFPLPVYALGVWQLAYNGNAVGYYHILPSTLVFPTASVSVSRLGSHFLSTSLQE